MEYQICTRCIIDTTVPGVKFDENGECNFCKLHDKLEKQYPLNEKGEKRFKKLVEKIKASGKKNNLLAFLHLFRPYVILLREAVCPYPDPA